MGSLKENKRLWGESYSWSNRGDEWSAAWGGTHHMWYGTILPRILNFMPTGRMLEIAPGFGRCTQFLKDLCDELIVVDLNKNCIEACKERFASSNNIKYFQNDGLNLGMVKDTSIDFIFSWDSLVHANEEAMRSYIKEFGRILSPNGYGFIHHSNMGFFKNGCKHSGWRGNDVSGPLFDDICKSYDLALITQEYVNWGKCKNVNDCISLFCRNKPKIKKSEVFENFSFMEEASRLKKISEMYSPDYDKKVSRVNESVFLKVLKRLNNKLKLT